MLVQAACQENNPKLSVHFHMTCPIVRLHLLSKDFEMTLTTRIIGSIILILTITGCANRASSVAPVAVTSGDYAKLSCEQARLMLGQKREIENVLIKQQNNAALGDTVGVFFVLLPLGSVFGADKEGELAIAKGEVDAIERMISTNCS